MGQAASTLAGKLLPGALKFATRKPMLLGAPASS